MRCVVFGGGGFLGSYICEELLISGHDVVIFEKSSAQLGNIMHIADKVSIIEGDFSNVTDVQQALNGSDVLFHLISTTTPQLSNNDPAQDVQDNLISTIKLLEAAKRAGIKKVVFFSSGGTVYGKPQYTPIREDHPNAPICSYGIQKLAIEKYLHLFYHLYGLDYNVLRAANPYGPRQAPHSGQGVIAAFIHQVIAGKPIEIWGDGSVIRDYIFASDVAKAAVALLNYRGIQKIFNIGSGEGKSLLDIVRIIENLTGTTINIDFKESRAADVPVNILDIRKANTELEWTPSVGFTEGLTRTLDCITANICRKSTAGSENFASGESQLKEHN